MEALAQTAPGLVSSGTATLATLADVALPPPPGWWPQTTGWIVLGVVLLLALLWAAVRSWRHYRANRYRREALHALEVLRPAAMSADAAVRADALLATAELLKRSALAAWPRAQVAGLSGAAWAQFLAQHAGGAQPAAAMLAPFVADAQYQGASALARMPAADAQALFDASHDWLARHRVSA